jgi:site-specific DNA recombinase
MTSAFGYLRLSKDDPDSTSIARQQDAIEHLCAARGWELREVFEDVDVSGYKRGTKRPALDRLLSRLGGVDAVAVYRIDRLGRNFRQLADLFDRFQEAGVVLAATDMDVDSASPAGAFMRDMVARMGQFESDTLSARSKAMHAHKQANGEWTGRVPYGWRLEGKVLVPVEEEQGVIEQIARRYIAGESLRSIARSLGLHHPNLARMLKSDRVLEALPPEVAGPLATELAERGRTGTRAKRSLLGGIARCGVCGAGMTVVAKRKDGRGSYGCRKSHVGISQMTLDAFALGLTTGVRERMYEALGGELRRIRSQEKKTHRTYAEIEERVEQLDDDYHTLGHMRRDSYLRRREKLVKQLTEVREHDWQDRLNVERFERAWQILEFGGEEIQDFPLHLQRELIQSVLEALVVHPVSKRRGRRVDFSRIAPRYRPWVKMGKADEKLLTSERYIHGMIVNSSAALRRVDERSAAPSSSRSGTDGEYSTALLD